MELPEGLPCLVGKSPRVMVLGSFPGAKSLEKAQYYGNPKNQFWKIVECLLGIPESLHYDGRTRMIRDAGIALWDVIRSCERNGSMDHGIRNVRQNNIPAVLDQCPSINLIALNGGTAGKYFARAWPEGFPGVMVVVLPSTSPANARLDLEEKVRLWRCIIGEEISGRTGAGECPED